MVFDYHYYNTSREEIAASERFQLSPRKARRHASTSRAALSSTTTPSRRRAKAAGKFTGECRFKQDVMVGQLTRHTHRWGTDYSVWFEGGARHGELIWTSNDWQHETNHLSGAAADEAG